LVTRDAVPAKTEGFNCRLEVGIRRAPIKFPRTFIDQGKKVNLCGPAAILGDHGFQTRLTRRERMFGGESVVVKVKERLGAVAVRHEKPVSCPINCVLNPTRGASEREYCLGCQEG